MIGLQINDEFIDLFPDTKINLILNNTIFLDDDIIPGSISIPFDIPGPEISGRNARIIGGADMVEHTIRSLLFKNTILWFDGIPYKKGDFKINPVSGQKFTGNFIFGLQTISTDFKKKKIREIMDETITMTAETFSRKVYIAPSMFATPPPYTIQINGTDVEANTLSDLATAINNSTDINPPVTAVYVPSGSAPLGLVAPYISIEPNLSTGDPMELFHVTGAGGQLALDWDVEVEDISDYLNSIKAFVETYIDAAPPDNKFRFPMAANAGLYEEDDKQLWDRLKAGFIYSNWAPDGSLVLNSLNNGTWNTVNFTNLQPFVMLRYVLDQIASEFGFGYEGDFFDDPYLDEAIFVSPSVVDIVLPYLGARAFLFWPASFNLKSFVPDITVEQLFKELQKKLNLGISFNEDINKIRITKRKSLLLADPFLDLTDISGPVEGIDLVAVTGVRLESKIDEKDSLATEDFYESGTPETTIESMFSSLADDLKGTAFSYIQMHQKANEAFTPRLAFYKGLDATLGYPKASAEGWKMRYGGAGNLGETEFVEFIRFLKNRKLVKLKMDIPFRILKAVDWEKIYTVDRNRYMFKSISLNLTMEGAETSAVELYSL